MLVRQLYEDVPDERGALKLLQSHGLLLTEGRKCSQSSGNLREEYQQNRVNHSQNYVDPKSGYHTQGIERTWVECKSKTKATRGANHHLQYFLDEIAWRRSVASSNAGIWNEFWKAVREVHANE